MKRLVFTSFLLLFLSLNLLSQNTVGSGNLTDGFKIVRGDTKGTPFLTEEWHVGYGIFENGNTSRPQKMNYDIHGNNLVYQTAENREILKLVDNAFKGFILKAEEKDFLFSKIEGNEFANPKKETKYYQIVEAPSQRVIIEFEKELKDPNASGWTSSNANTKTAEYKMHINYYVLNTLNKYEEVKLKERSVLNVFKDRKEDLRAYITQNNLDINSPEELLEIVNYYYSL